jgi:sigma-B regulation protein RsbU (phosphoserine phosphatase)
MLTIEQLNSQVTAIIFGTVFLMIGFLAAGIAVIRPGKGGRILFWLSLWSGSYGARVLIHSPAVTVNFPPWLQRVTMYGDVTLSYLIIVFASLAWLELIKGRLRIFIITMIWAGLALAAAGIAWYLTGGSSDALMPYNSLLAACSLLVLIIVVSIKKLSAEYLVLQDRGVLAAGTIIFAAEALYTNFSTIFDYPTLPLSGWLGFAVFLFSLAYAAAKMIFENEHRLLSIETELETARQIQFSILPDAAPQLSNLDVEVAYHPMAAVAGDFYDFMPIDTDHAGFIIADVSGHGVPAALIASMIKIAMQSVADQVPNPAGVMERLGVILGNQLRGQFLSAAYLYLDTKDYRARYTAAGHPPLLYWDASAQKVQPINSNGLLIGVPWESDYPVYEFSFRKGDRFLLYTDGLTEPENEAEEAFGDQYLSRLIEKEKETHAAELSKRLYDELKNWQRPSTDQQDDLTWIIIDVL